MTGDDDFNRSLTDALAPIALEAPLPEDLLRVSGAWIREEAIEVEDGVYPGVLDPKGGVAQDSRSRQVPVDLDGDPDR